MDENVNPFFAMPAQIVRFGHSGTVKSPSKQDVDTVSALQFRLAPVDRAISNAPEQLDGPVGLAQRQRSGVGSDGSTVESRDDPAPVKAFKSEPFADTACRHRTTFTNLTNLCCKRIFLGSMLHLP
jgi:hypothetical protein